MAKMPKFEYTLREVKRTNQETAVYAFISGWMLGGFVAWLVLR
jgi:uncharacterized membrane protein SpoIIM required for sporulation